MRQTKPTVSKAERTKTGARISRVNGLEWTHVTARDGDVELTVSVRGRFEISRQGVEQIRDRLGVWLNDNVDTLAEQGLIRVEVDYVSTRR